MAGSERSKRMQLLRRVFDPANRLGARGIPVFTCRHIFSGQFEDLPAAPFQPSVEQVEADQHAEEDDAESINYFILRIASPVNVDHHTQERRPEGKQQLMEIFGAQEDIQVENGIKKHHATNNPHAHEDIENQGDDTEDRQHGQRNDDPGDIAIRFEFKFERHGNLLANEVHYIYTSFILNYIIN